MSYQLSMFQTNESTLIVHACAELTCILFFIFPSIDLPINAFKIHYYDPYLHLFFFSVESFYLFDSLCSSSLYQLNLVKNSLLLRIRMEFLAAHAATHRARAFAPTSHSKARGFVLLYVLQIRSESGQQFLPKERAN